MKHCMYAQVHHSRYTAEDLDADRIFSYDQCNVMQPVGEYSHGPVCDMFLIVPRKLSDVVFSAVGEWDHCHGSSNNTTPCHVQVC